MSASVRWASRATADSGLQVVPRSAPLAGDLELGDLSERLDVARAPRGSRVS